MCKAAFPTHQVQCKLIYFSRHPLFFCQRCCHGDARTSKGPFLMTGVFTELRGVSSPPIQVHANRPKTPKPAFRPHLKLQKIASLRLDRRLKFLGKPNRRRESSGTSPSHNKDFPLQSQVTLMRANSSPHRCPLAQWSGRWRPCCSCSAAAALTYANARHYSTRPLISITPNSGTFLVPSASEGAPFQLLHTCKQFPSKCNIKGNPQIPLKG